MSNYEESAKAIPADYRFAPVGMAVGSFWGGALIAGLAAFSMSTGIAKGIGVPTSIVDNQRVLFANDQKGMIDGLLIAVILFVMSLLLGLAAHSAARSKKDLGGFWKLMPVVPLLSLVVTVLVIAFNH